MLHESSNSYVYHMLFLLQNWDENTGKQLTNEVQYFNAVKY